MANTPLPTWYTQQQQHAWDLYQQTPFPTQKEIVWKRTDLRGFPWHKIQPPSAARDAIEIPQKIQQTGLGATLAGETILAGNGVWSHTLAPELRERGVIFTDLLTALRDHSDLIQPYLGSIVPASAGKFAQLATAWGSEGIFLYIPPNVTVEQPFHSILWATEATHCSRILVVAAPGSKAIFFHELTSPEGSEPTLHAGTVEIICQENASLTFVEIQSLGQHVWNFSHERSQVGRNGRLDWIFGGLGSKLTKNFSEIDLVGEGATGRMSGFYFAENRQHLDHDTQQNHLAPHTTSDLLFKGALTGHSQSVWQGMIYVAPGAQKTDGFQANRNLLLSSTARADSIPGLEILADDVRCTHAATAGQMEQQHLFYLKSRGIPEPEARRLIVEGFYDPILQRIPFPSVQERLLAFLHEKIG